MARRVEGSSRLPLNSWQAEATLSSCGAYRWLLHRPIPSREPSAGQRRLLLFIGLNPSRADGRRDDPTLRRLQGFAHHWGYHHLVVLNLFARISPSPSLLCSAQSPLALTMIRPCAAGSNSGLNSPHGISGWEWGLGGRFQATGRGRVWNMLNDVSDQPGVLPALHL